LTVPTPPSTDNLHASLREQAARSGENFSVLSPLLPKDLIHDFATVYAFCRRADDLADDIEPTPEGRQTALENLRSFRQCLRAHLEPGAEPAEHPDGPMLARLAETVHRRGVRSEHLHHLLDAFERDQHQTRYETWDDLLSYCEGSANPVGRIVLELGGLDTVAPEHTQIVTWCDSVCTALQLTNHWQDVRRDLLERDRVYLPSEETGLTADDLRAMIADPKNPELRVRYIRAVRPLVDRTGSMYRDARPLPRALAETTARRIAPTVWLLSAGGEHTLSRIERTGCTTLYRRPRLGKLSKAMLIANAWIVSKRLR
jgi:squalene synthase HpnC